jgi:hypothetical protein
MDSTLASPEEAVVSPAETARVDIRARIEDAIRPWRFAMEKPPFTPKELLVMALVTADGPLPATHILGWVLMNFQFFSICASKAAWKIHLEDDGRECNEEDDEYWLPDLASEIEQEMIWFDLPLKFHPKTPTTDCTWSISPANARNLLPAEIRNKPQLGAFRFFELTAELRNIIYEMVFGYPKAGLAVLLDSTTDALVKSFFLPTRSYSQEFNLRPSASFTRSRILIPILRYPAGLLRCKKSCRHS